MSTKLYHHKTDGGAEYLCSSPVDGTDEGDLHTAIIRLDGEPELLNPSALVAPELLEALKNGLLNEGQDACCLPIVNPCHCWRCQARRVIAKAEQ